MKCVCFTVNICKLWFEKIKAWNFPGGPVAKTVLPVRGTWVHPLVRELRWEILSAAEETHCSQTNKLKKSKVETLI